MLNKAIKKAKENKKGFTLAELLIVVAIIAVLVAISIPIFTTQLEKSREAVDVANIRAAYAECASSVLTDDKSAGYYEAVELRQSDLSKWVIDVSDVAGVDISGVTMSNKTMYVNVAKDGTFTFAASATNNFINVKGTTTGSGTGSTGDSNS